MRRITVEAEISARSYKKLCEAMKGFNKKQLWKIMDHYIFHIMEDKHVEELLQILKTFEETKSFDDPKPAPQPVPEPVVVAAAEPEEDIHIGRPVFADALTQKDLEASKDKLNLLFDVNYFTYLKRDVAVANAKALIDFSKKTTLKPAPHWYLVAILKETNFFDAAEDDHEDGDDE